MFAFISDLLLQKLVGTAMAFSFTSFFLPGLLGNSERKDLSMWKAWKAPGVPLNRCFELLD